MGYYFFWAVGAIIMLLPIWMALFTVFLMLTQSEDDVNLIEDGSWGQDVDHLAKKRYNSKH